MRGQEQRAVAWLLLMLAPFFGTCLQERSSACLSASHLLFSRGCAVPAHVSNATGLKQTHYERKCLRKFAVIVEQTTWLICPHHTFFGRTRCLLTHWRAPRQRFIPSSHSHFTSTRWEFEGKNEGSAFATSNLNHVGKLSYCMFMCYLCVYEGDHNFSNTLSLQRQMVWIHHTNMVGQIWTRKSGCKYWWMFTSDSLGNNFPVAPSCFLNIVNCIPLTWTCTQSDAKHCLQTCATPKSWGLHVNHHSKV